MTKQYLFKIKPLDRYFFGTENRRMRAMNEEEKEAETANYFLHSSPFPSPTTLLGSLRYFFLKNVAAAAVFKDNKIQDKDQAAALIGAKSFNLNQENSFGAIQSVSEVFLLNAQGEAFFCAAF
ncbi:MAG: hypothetical protein IPL35_12745 [Sphingobacteriales bacterium]|nr:hypothetical protein [Sphingobacteriales bacterium]